MASTVQVQMQVSAQDGTSVTLIPAVVGSGSLKRDLASPITQIVLTMGARDTSVFDIVGRVFGIEIEKK
jgi:hypothetical protein